MYKCKYCGKEFENQRALAGHTAWCELNPNHRSKEDCAKARSYKGKNSKPDQIHYCQYCGKECKNNNSLAQHEIRCKQNPNRIECHGNRGNMPKTTKRRYTSKVKMRNGDVLDITLNELDEYRKTHLVCEICGRPIEDCVKWDSKFAPKNFCIDHDHESLKFRGLLCSICNRQLGWYEKYKKEIENYLNKNSN